MTLFKIRIVQLVVIIWLLAGLTSYGQETKVADLPKIASQFESILPESAEDDAGVVTSILPIPDATHAFPVSGTVNGQPIGSYPFFDPQWGGNVPTELIDPRSVADRYLLQPLDDTVLGAGNKLKAPGFEDVSVYMNHPAVMPRTRPSSHYRILAMNSKDTPVGRQSVGYDSLPGSVPAVQPPPGLLTTYVQTATGLFPQPDPIDQPPGTNLLPTVYRNLLDRYGKEIPNTLPSHPNNPYNLHESPPEVAQLKTLSSPSDDLRLTMEHVYEILTGESPRRLWESLDQVNRETLRQKVEANLDNIPDEIDLMKHYITWAKDIVEGNQGNGSKVPSNRAYAGFSLINHSGHHRKARVKPVFDESGKVIGGNIDVHQIWYEGRIQSDTMFYDFGWDDNPDLWKDSAGKDQLPKPLPSDVPWTITYTVDVLSRGEDDFSNMTMYFDAPDKILLEGDILEDKEEELVWNQVAAHPDCEQDADACQELSQQVRKIWGDEKGKKSANWVETFRAPILQPRQRSGEIQYKGQTYKQDVVEAYRKTLKAVDDRREQVIQGKRSAKQANPATYSVQMVEYNRKENIDAEPFRKRPTRLGPWHCSMDQSFFPMEEGTRNVFTIKMAPAEYFNLTYTWGWRRHPSRAQATENVHKRVPPRTPYTLQQGVKVLKLHENVPRLIPPRLFSQLRINDHERYVFEGIRDPAAEAQRYANEPIPTVLLIGAPNAPAAAPKPLREGQINIWLALDVGSNDFKNLPQALKDALNAIRGTWNATKPAPGLVQKINLALFDRTGTEADQVELTKIRSGLQMARFGVLMNSPIFTPPGAADDKTAPYNMISDLAPAKRMWRSFTDMKRLAEKVGTDRNDQATKDLVKEICGREDVKVEECLLNCLLDARRAWLDWSDRKKLPSGIEPDQFSDLTLLYVNNTIYGQFPDGGITDFPGWRKRGDDVKVTLINGDYFPHGYLNVDFGGNRGWENQFKPTLALGGPGMFFTFGRFHWRFNTEPGAIGCPPAVMQKFVRLDSGELDAIPQGEKSPSFDPGDGMPGSGKWFLELEDGSTRQLEPGQAFVFRKGAEIGMARSKNYYAVVEDIVRDSSNPTPLSHGGVPIYQGQRPDSVRPFVHRVWMRMNFEPGQRLRFYQFDPLHHDAAIYSIH